MPVIKECRQGTHTGRFVTAWVNRTPVAARSVQVGGLGERPVPAHQPGALLRQDAVTGTAERVVAVLVIHEDKDVLCGPVAHALSLARRRAGYGTRFSG